MRFAAGDGIRTLENRRWNRDRDWLDRRGGVLEIVRPSGRIDPAGGWLFSEADESIILVDQAALRIPIPWTERSKRIRESPGILVIFPKKRELETTMASDRTMMIGEALAGEGNEVAHIDLLIGSKNGPVGAAFANALANQSRGHTNLLAVLTPNLPVKPSTILITKVTIDDMRQVLQMFGPAQYAVAKAVADSVADGVIPAAEADDLVIVCGVFIHPAAADNAKIQKFNYEAVKLAIQRAMRNEPSAAEVTKQKDSAHHPFA